MGVGMFSCEAALDDLGHGTSASTRNLEDVLVERDQSGHSSARKASGVMESSSLSLVASCSSAREWGESVILCMMYD